MSDGSVELICGTAITLFWLWILFGRD